MLVFEDIVIYTPMYVTGFWALVLMISSVKKNKAKQGLGIFMIMAFFLYLSHAIFFKNQFLLYLYFDPIYISSSLAVYPMYLCYIKLLTVESKFNLKNLTYFIPAVLLGISSSVVYLLMSVEERNEYILGFIFRHHELGFDSILIKIQKSIFYLSRSIFMIQVVLVLIYGRKLVIRYNTRIANFYSNLESRSLVWVNRLLYSFVIISIMSIVFNILGRTSFSNSSMLLTIPSVIFSVLLFVIGFQGYMQNNTIIDLRTDELEMEEIGVKDFNMAILKENLIELFEIQKIYRQSDLKITHVSLLLQTNRTYVSNLLNAEFGRTFNDFVNQYRVNEVKNTLQNTAHHNLSLDFVAEAAGFGSMSSFIRIFRKSEGITPGKYRDQIYMKKNSA